METMQPINTTNTIVTWNKCNAVDHKLRLNVKRETSDVQLRTLYLVVTGSYAAFSSGRKYGKYEFPSQKFHLFHLSTRLFTTRKIVAFNSMTIIPTLWP